MSGLSIIYLYPAAIAIVSISQTSGIWDIVFPPF